MYHTSRFSRLAKWTASTMGRPITFITAVAVILGWLLTGPIFGYSDSWQLIINTATTIVTFLMVFLIQNTQNRDSEAMQLKLDELIRSTQGAHNALLDLEELTEEEVHSIKASYEILAQRSREDIKKGILDTGTPDVRPRT